MTSSSWTFSPHSSPPPPAPGDTLTDYRSRIALEQFHAEERRRHELAEQSSAANTPEARIRIWEKVHRLTLPSSPTHPVLRCVAAATELTLAQVQEEQRQRLAHRAAPLAVAQKA